MMARHGYYGSKCYKCAHLDGPTHDVEQVWPVAHDECPSCGFCQQAAFYGAWIRAASVEADVFSPEARAATKALLSGKSHPLIDQLRAELRFPLYLEGTEQ